MFLSASYIVVAVKKQRGRSEQNVEFPRITLQAVDPPSSKMSSYSLPVLMSGTERLYPLFDSDGKVNFLLCSNFGRACWIVEFSHYQIKIISDFKLYIELGVFCSDL